MDPTTALTAAIKGATDVAQTSLFTTVIDKVTGFKISQWAAEGEIRKRQINDEYEKAKTNGIAGVQYISALRSSTNLINTAVKTAKYVKPDTTNQIEMDNDFFWNTIEYSKDVSNEEMQELIAQIIAGEYNNPGTYSMQTLQTLKMLGKRELTILEDVCCLLINGDQIPQEVFSPKESIKEVTDELDIDFAVFQRLQSLGLFFPNSMTRAMSNISRDNFSLTYFNKKISFESEDQNNTEIRLTHSYVLSPVGRQILEHLSPKYNEKYFTWLKQNYKIQNYKFVE